MRRRELQFNGLRASGLIYDTSMISRRDLLAHAVAAALTAAVAGTSARAVAVPPATPSRARLAQLLDKTAESLLADYPESATFLGLDSGEHAQLQARLTSRSIDGAASLAERCRASLRELRAFDASQLSGLDAINFASTLEAFELAAEGYDQFSYGDNTFLDTFRAENITPYVVNQSGGLFGTLPDLMDNSHKIESVDNAERYLQRLRALAQGLDAENERLQRDAGLGVIAPDFVLDTTLALQQAYIATPIEQWGLVESLARRAHGHGLPGDWQARAVDVCTTTVGPALARQIDTLKLLRARAGHEAGVRRLPHGESYYQWTLKVGTTTKLSPAEVHRLGLERVDSLSSEMDKLLHKQGLRHGTVGQRLDALSRDPAQLYPNDDAGRARLLEYLNDVVADMRARLPRAFATQKKADLVVKRVPPSIEAGAPGGYEQDGPIDGSAPASYYINLRDTASYPKFTLPTLCYHEGVPGHVWQGVFVHDLPLIRTQLQFNAYGEGWALYAEQLGDELGAYETDPLGRLGYLQSIQFRACRLVVDTGLHAQGWSREKAIRWIVDQNGVPPEAARDEIDRYCSFPGQACGYLIGHQRFVSLRKRAQAALGRGFDLRTFNDALLSSGSVPLTILEQVIDRYIASRRGSRA